MVETNNWTMEVSVESLKMQKKKMNLDSDAEMMGCVIKNYTSFKKHKMETGLMMVATGFIGIVLGMILTL
jgi:hypothetical protein